MGGDRDDQQHQHRGLGDRLIDDAVHHRPERHHDQHGEQDLHREAELGQRQQAQECDHRERVADIDREHARQLARLPGPQRPEPIEGGDGDAGAEQQPGRGGEDVVTDHREGERAIGDELSLRNEDHPGDGEHEHEREREQRIDGAVGDAVLAEDQCNLKIHGREPPRAPVMRRSAIEWTD